MTDFIKQSTIGKEVSCSGIGVHSGKITNMILKPAPENTGILFIRTDIKDKNNIIPARWDMVSDTRLCTVISNKSEVSVGTVEHILSAIYASNIDNIIIEIDNAEIPIMDGSSEEFVKLLDKAGVEELKAPKNFLLVKSKLSVKHDDKVAELRPAATQSFHFTIDFSSKAVGKQSCDLTLSSNDYSSEISRARTFGFLHEVEAMRSMGLAKGGSLENAVVIDGDSVLNPEGLRYKTEFARHKLLDAIGDIALSGMQVIAHYHGIKSGHHLNNLLLHKVFSTPDAWEIVNLTEQQYRAMNSASLRFDKRDIASQFIVIGKQHLEKTTMQ